VIEIASGADKTCHHVLLASRAAHAYCAAKGRSRVVRDEPRETRSLRSLCSRSRVEGLFVSPLPVGLVRRVAARRLRVRVSTISRKRTRILAVLFEPGENMSVRGSIQIAPGCRRRLSPRRRPGRPRHATSWRAAPPRLAVSTRKSRCRKPRALQPSSPTSSDSAGRSRTAPTKVEAEAQGRAGSSAKENRTARVGARKGASERRRLSGTWTARARRTRRLKICCCD